MKKLARVVAVQLLAAAVSVTVLAGPARARSAESDAQLAAEWQFAWDFYKFYQRVTAPLPATGRRRVERDISVDINAPRERVFAAYSDVNNHLGKHPFLKRVVTHRDHTESGTRHVDFTAFEQIPVAGLPVTSKTHAQQRIDLGGFSYETDTWTAPNIVTHQKAVFEDLGGGRTRVIEHLAFEANLLLIDFTVTNGVSAHQQTQTALKQAIESGRL